MVPSWQRCDTLPIRVSLLEQCLDCAERSVSRQGETRTETPRW